MSMQLPFTLFEKDVPVEKEGGLSSRKIVFATEDGRFYFGAYHINGCCYSIDTTDPVFPTFRATRWKGGRTKAIAWVYWSAVESVLSAHMGGE